LNTSLNVRGEPIVCTPVDALVCMVRADLDALVLGDYLIDRALIPPSWRALLATWETRPRPISGATGSAPQENLYTFA
jgi:carbamoyltransferase